MSEQKAIEKLKPCPFCGGQANIGIVKYPEDSNAARLNKRFEGYFLHCEQCSAALRFGLSYATEDEAVKAWNKRAGDDSTMLECWLVHPIDDEDCTDCLSVRDCREVRKRIEQLQAEIDMLKKENAQLSRQAVLCGKTIKYLRADNKRQLQVIGEIAMQRDTLRTEIMKRSEAEAAVCPEDVGAVEYIKTLRTELEELKKLYDTRSVPANIPHIVCLCGSTRFMDAFFEAGWKFALEGKIVLSVGVCRHAEHHGAEALGQDVADRLDELHCRKIDIADSVFVLNVGGYIGDSTRKEIEYAESRNKPISYLESCGTVEDEDQALKDEKGSERE